MKMNREAVEVMTLGTGGGSRPENASVYFGAGGAADRTLHATVVMPLAEQRGGAELMLLHLLRASVAREDITYDVVFLEAGPMEEDVRALGYAVTILSAGRLRQPLPFVRAVQALVRHLRHVRTDVVLSWMAKGHLYGGAAAWIAGLPAVWFQHVITARNWLDRVVTRVPAVGILCCSEAAAVAQRRLSPRRPLRIVYPAVDLARFTPERLPPPEAARRLLGMPEAGLVVGMVGRLQRWKGIHVFVEAAARLLADGRDVTFVVVGGAHAREPEYARMIEEQVCLAGFGDRIRLVGFQPNVADWMQAMDVVVHASVEPEPFGMVLLEGLALGKAVVATRSGGPLEIIRKGEGVLMPPGDARALAGAIQVLGDDAALRSQLGRAGQRRAQDFSTDRLASSVAAGLRAFAMPDQKRPSSEA